jgi:hypothetical protein
LSELRENRPEGWGIVGNWQQYFDDPALDRLAEITMDLAATTWTLLDRQKVTEWILEEKATSKIQKLTHSNLTKNKKRNLLKQGISLLQIFLMG